MTSSPAQTVCTFDWTTESEIVFALAWEGERLRPCSVIRWLPKSCGELRQPLRTGEIITNPEIKEKGESWRGNERKDVMDKEQEFKGKIT